MAKEEFSVLATGIGGSVELSITHNETGTYMDVDDGFIYFNFTLRDDEVHLLKAIISFAKEDDIKVSKSSQSMTIGKFGAFRVELLKDDEHTDCIILLIGRSSINMIRHMNKDDFVAACEDALEELVGVA